MYIVTVVDLYASGAARASMTYHIDKSKITIGRDRSNDIVLQQTDVSGTHASIKVTKKGLLLTDLKSTNGIKVNRERIHGSVTISSKDEIQIGGAILKLSGHALLERTSSPAGNSDLGRSAMDLDEGDSIATPPSFAPDPRQGTTDPFEQAPRQRESYNPSPDHEDRDPYSYAARRERAQSGPSPLSLLVPAEDREDPFAFAPSPSRDLSPSMAFPSLREPNKDSLANSGSSSICDIISDLEARQSDKRAVPTRPPISVPSQPPLRKMSGTDDDTVSSENAILSTLFWKVGIGRAHGQTRQFATHSITIGRSPSNSLSLPCPKVSTHHARLEYHNRRLILEDLRSTNGTQINGTPLQGRAEVTENDLVSIGSFECSFSFQIMERREPSRINTQSDPSTVMARKEIRPAITSQAEAAAGRFPSLADSSPPPSIRKTPSLSRPASDLPSEGQRSPLQPKRSEAARPPATKLPQAEQPPPRDESPSEKDHAIVARQELGTILDQVQDLGLNENENRYLCTCIAAALRQLFPILADKAPHHDIERLSQDALVSVREALAVSLGSGSLMQYADGLTAALAYLFPLSGLAARNPEATPGSVLPRVPASRPDNIVAPLPAVQANETGLVARFIVRADTSSLEGVGEVVSSISRSFLFDETQVPEIRCAVEEACANVVLHAFDFPGQGYLEVSFFTNKDRELVIIVDDRGLPYDFDKLASGETAGMGVAVMRALCPRVQFISRGREGKRVQLSFELPPRHTGVFSGPKFDVDKVFGVSGASRYEVVPLGPDAAVEIAKCAYRSESYDHQDERIYDAALQERRLGDGTQLSVMAISEQGHGVGHLAVVRHKPDSPAGQVEELVIVPQLRGSNMMSRLAQGLMACAREKGMHGLTIATPASQKYQRIAIRSLGAVPMGYFITPSFGLEGSPMTGRAVDDCAVALMSYLPLAQDREKQVYLPPHHAEMILWSYRELCMDRICLEPSKGQASTMPALSEFKCVDHVVPRGVVFKIAMVGEDLLDVLAAHIQDLKGQPACAVFVDLPLELSETATICRAVEQLGFVFSCLLPNTDQGDVLRLQFQLPCSVSLSKIEAEGPYESSLKQYVDSLFQRQTSSSTENGLE